jgi:hypothetical protein
MSLMMRSTSMHLNIQHEHDNGQRVAINYVLAGMTELR